MPMKKLASWRTTWAGRLVAIAALVGALAHLLSGDVSSIDVPRLIEALSVLGIGIGGWVGLGAARNDKVTSEEARQIDAPKQTG